MTIYKQTDYNDKLGTCSDTIAQSGCFITCLAMLAEIPPPEVNRLLIDNRGYKSGCLVDSLRASEILKLPYYGISNNKPNYTCIAETNYYAPKVPQHFFIVTKEGKKIDPLGKNIDYPIVSYRLFRERETMKAQDVYYLVEPYWRSLHSMQVPNEASLMKECEDIANRMQNGEAWAGAKYRDKWWGEFMKDHLDKLCPAPTIKEVIVEKEVPVIVEKEVPVIIEKKVQKELTLQEAIKFVFQLLSEKIKAIIKRS